MKYSEKDYVNVKFPKVFADAFDEFIQDKKLDKDEFLTALVTSSVASEGMSKFFSNLYSAMPRAPQDEGCSGQKCYALGADAIALMGPCPETEEDCRKSIPDEIKENAKTRAKTNADNACQNAHGESCVCRGGIVPIDIGYCVPLNVEGVKMCLKASIAIYSGVCNVFL